MKMSRIEKWLVNRPAHSREVARRAEDRLRLVSPRPGQSLLDVGCGNGEAAIRAVRVFGLEATGVGVDPEQIEAAGRAAAGMPGVRFLAVDAGRLPFPDGHFDLVASSKVTHHIPHWPAAFAEMVRVLKPGGWLLYDDFVLPSWGPARFPNRRALRALVGESGLGPVRVAAGLLHLEAVWWKPGPVEVL